MILRALIDRLTGSALARVDMRDVQCAAFRWSHAYEQMGCYRVLILIDAVHERHCVSAARVDRARRGRA